MTNHSCQSDSVLLWKAIATGHNDILELISTILDELLELNGKFLNCCNETNANLDEIINQLDVLIQNLIDCCEGICDRLDDIIEILEERYPTGVEYGITYGDYICIEEWSCDVGGEYLECDFEDCLPEPPEIEYEVNWDEYVCVEEPATTTTTTELPTTTTTTCVIGAGLIEVLCDDWTTTTTEEPATTTTTTQVGTTSTTTVSETTSTTTILPTTTTTEEPTTTTTTIIEPQTDYGYLYNWWAAIGDTDGDNVADTSIANDGWHLPSKTEWETLMANIGATDLAGEEWGNAGIYLKETGYTYWTDSGDPTEAGQDTYGFALRGTGERRSSFQDIKDRTKPWTSTGGTGSIIHLAWEFQFKSDSKNCLAAYAEKYSGQEIRLLRDSTPLSEGQTGTYTGNNGIVYPTICIGTGGNEQEWTSVAIEETKFRDGSDIPYIDNQYAEDDAEWAAATSAAYCIYPIP